MHFVVIGRDKDASLRLRLRAEHLEFIADRQAAIIYSGPLLEDGRMVGSLFLFELPDRAALDAALADDPYFREELFETVEVFETRRMVPESEPGALRREAERARAAFSG